jgi:hypothetical protein
MMFKVSTDIPGGGTHVSSASRPFLCGPRSHGTLNTRFNCGPTLRVSFDPLKESETPTNTPATPGLTQGDSGTHKLIAAGTGGAPTFAEVADRQETTKTSGDAATTVQRKKKLVPSWSTQQVQKKQRQH